MIIAPTAKPAASQGLRTTGASLSNAVSSPTTPAASRTPATASRAIPPIDRTTMAPFPPLDCRIRLASLAWVVYPPGQNHH